MDRWERTKIWTAVAMAGVVMASGWWFSGQVISPSYPEKRGYPIEGVVPVDLAAAQRAWPGGEARPGEKAELLGYIRAIETATVPSGPAGSGPAEVAPPPVDLGTLLAAADAERGRRTAQVCASCHTVDAGGPNRVGPNLWGIAGRKVASYGGFPYSPALAGAGGNWSYDALDRFLASPMRAIPGTKMTFAGIRNPRDRANLLAYLATLGPGAPPFPAPAPAAVAAPAPTAPVPTAASTAGPARAPAAP